MPLVVIPPVEEHCNVFTTPVYVPDFDPNNVQKSIEGIEIPEPIFGGCYETAADALRSGTNGVISLPSDATTVEINQAILDYGASAPTTKQADNVAQVTPAILAVGWEGIGYTGSAYYMYDYSGLGCILMDYWFHFPDFSTSPGWNNNFDSIVGYTQCDDMWLFDNPNDYESTYYYAWRWDAKLFNPLSGIDYRNRASSAVIGNYSLSTYNPYIP